MEILVAYASAHGSTAEIASFMGHVLEAYDANVTVAHVDAVDTVDKYDAVIVGSPIHASMWLPSVSKFMFRNEKQLAAKRTFLFIACIIVLEEGGVEKALKDYVWGEAKEKLQIDENIGVFAGKLDMNSVDGSERWMLGSYEGKQLPGRLQGDYREWQEIADWVHQIAESLTLLPNFEHVVKDEQATKDETVDPDDPDTLKWPTDTGDNIQF